MIKWPKLSETLSPVIDLNTCQHCGSNDVSDLHPSRWREHDDNDNPTTVVVLLCKACGDAIIEPHPRLYERLDYFCPAPGSMPVCADCKFRNGVTCKHSDLKGNGGLGLPLKMPKPGVMFVDGRDSKGKPFGYQMTQFKGPVICDAKEAS